MGAFYLLLKKHEEFGRTFLRIGVIAGFAAALLAFPTGDRRACWSRATSRSRSPPWKGHFETCLGSAMAILGQPDVEKRRLDNPFIIPGMLSFIVHKRWEGEVRGLDAFPQDQWPDNIPLLYYCFHIMVGLGTLFIGVDGSLRLYLWRGSAVPLQAAAVDC